MTRHWRTDAGVFGLDEGPEDPAIAGTPLVLLASLGTTLRVHDEVTSVLVAAGHRVIRIDLRGHGRSSGSAPVASITDLAGDVADVIAMAGLDRVSVMGCSVGAMAAVRFAADAGHRCERLVLTGAAAAFRPADMWRQRIEAVRGGGMEALVGPTIERWVAERTLATRPEAVARIRRELLELDPGVFVDYARMMATADVGDQLDRIVSPTTVLVGDRDESSPVTEAHRLATGIRGAELRIIDDARHLVHLDQPRIVSDLLLDVLGREPDGPYGLADSSTSWG